MKYVKIFTDFLDVTASLSDGAMGRLFRAMLRYARDDRTPELKGKEGVLWPVARQQIDREKTAYADMVEARREAGRKGADARWQKMANHDKDGQDKDKEKDKDKDKDKDEDSLSMGGAGAPEEREKKPSLEEVTAFAQAAGLQTDVAYFYHYYEANGWHMGQRPIRDWRAALKAWALKNTAAKPPRLTDKELFQQAIQIHRSKEAKEI